MTIAILISALLLGLASSLHCIGMCGPLVLSVPVQHLPAPKKIAGILIYQLGRISTYTILGGLAGIIGYRIGVAGWQQTFSIIAGGTLISVEQGFHQTNKSLGTLSAKNPQTYWLVYAPAWL
jgi:uncharacterized protein